MSSQKTVAFLGASGGVGLSALKHSLKAGYNCIALCRTPSKLSAILPPSSNPNLRIVQGNAHDGDAVSQCFKKGDDANLVDEIIFTIGTRPNLNKPGFMDDPEVCRRGMATVLEAVSKLRGEGLVGRPLIVAFSTTGMSRFGRDTPLVILPFYKIVLKGAHEDKGIMEDRLADSGEDFTIVRASLLTNGESSKTVRAGIEDPKTGRESEAIGYTISREDAGKWVAQNLVLDRKQQYVNKIATITY